VEEMKPDPPLDYLKGLDEFISSYEDVFGDLDPQDIIHEIRG
jgi:hypothetical protein